MRDANIFVKLNKLVWGLEEQVKHQRVLVVGVATAAAAAAAAAVVDSATAAEPVFFLLLL